jgi:hypothetical protein
MAVSLPFIYSGICFSGPGASPTEISIHQTAKKGKTYFQVVIPPFLTDNKH